MAEGALGLPGAAQGGQVLGAPPAQMATVPRPLPPRSKPPRREEAQGGESSGAGAPIVTVPPWIPQNLVAQHAKSLDDWSLVQRWAEVAIEDPAAAIEQNVWQQYAPPPTEHGHSPSVVGYGIQTPAAALEHALDAAAAQQPRPTAGGRPVVLGRHEFDYYDLNSDGVLDRTEVERVLADVTEYLGFEISDPEHYLDGLMELYGDSQLERVGWSHGGSLYVALVRSEEAVEGATIRPDMVVKMLVADLFRSSLPLSTISF